MKKIIDVNRKSRLLPFYFSIIFALSCVLVCSLVGCSDSKSGGDGGGVDVVTEEPDEGFADEPSGSEDSGDIVFLKVLSTRPVLDAVGVEKDAMILAVLSEKVEVGSVDMISFSLKELPLGTEVVGSVSLAIDGTQVSFDPVNDLAEGKEYSVKLSKDIVAISGNKLAEDYVWKFQTKSADIVDETSPYVTSNSPIGDVVLHNSDVVVEFSEEMDKASVENSFELGSSEGASVSPASVAMSNDGKTFTFDIRTGDFEKGKTYTANITSSAKDLAGNGLGEDYDWTFKIIDPEAFVLLTDQLRPENGAVNINTLEYAIATFNKTPDKGTFNSAITMLMYDYNCEEKIGEMDWINTQYEIKIKPEFGFQPEQCYIIKINDSLKDLEGVSLSNPINLWQFRTNNYLKVKQTDPRMGNDDTKENAIVFTKSISEDVIVNFNESVFDHDPDHENPIVPQMILQKSADDGATWRMVSNSVEAFVDYSNRFECNIPRPPLKSDLYKSTVSHKTSDGREVVSFDGSKMKEDFVRYFQIKYMNAEVTHIDELQDVTKIYVEFDEYIRCGNEQDGYPLKGEYTVEITNPDNPEVQTDIIGSYCINQTQNEDGINMSKEIFIGARLHAVAQGLSSGYYKLTMEGVESLEGDLQFRNNIYEKDFTVGSLTVSSQSPPHESIDIGRMGIMIDLKFEENIACPSNLDGLIALKKCLNDDCTETEDEGVASDLSQCSGNILRFYVDDGGWYVIDANQLYRVFVSKDLRGVNGEVVPDSLSMWYFRTGVR